MNKKINGVKNCPNGHGPMEIRKLDKSMEFRGLDITFQAEHYVCPACGIEVGFIDQTAATQRAISDAYRKVVGLLTGKEIREGRNKLNLTQEDLAQKMCVGIASIKRWEGGIIQSKSMDKALRMALLGQGVGDVNTGNRAFSIPRVKLVSREFESLLHRKILKSDKGLYSAKYLWYADMVAFRELGQSMTGSTYACLPLGPQLNNYRDLINEIRNADENSVEPLTSEEKRIISRISTVFPQDQMVFKASHREVIVQRKSIGSIIPYSDAAELTEL
jgi:putative zinc finger/helix-turn-helix YgiT family protein